MNLILKGSADVTRYVFLVDSTAGTPETSYTITNLDLQYTRTRSAPATKVDATALAATDSAHADNKAIEIDATSSPGLYRVDWPDAAFASGADKVILVVSGTGLHPAVEEIQLVNFNPEDGVRLGLTALPNAAADAAGGLIISDAGGLDADAQLVTKINDILTDTGTTLQAEVDGIQADTEDIQTRLPAALVSGRIDASVGAIAANAITAASMAADASAEIADAVWDEDATGHQTGGTFGQAIGDPGADTTTIYQSVVTDAAGTHVAADIIAIKAETAAILDDTDDIGVAGAGLTALATQTSVNTIDDFLDTEIAAIKAKTDSLTFTTANQVDAQMLSGATGAITADVIAANAIGASELAADVITDIWQGTALTEAYAADGAAATPAQLLYLILAMLSEFAISGTTLTAKKLDGTTTAATFTLDSATDPTSITRAT